MRKATAGLASGLLLFTSAASAEGWNSFFDSFLSKYRGHHGHSSSQSFNRIATFANYTQPGLDIGDETVSEIVSATADGKTLVYTDAETESVGIVDITDPANPIGLGMVEVGGEPTSVDILGDAFALVAVNTSESFTNPSGVLVVVDIASQTIVNAGMEQALGGQPDSLKISPDGYYAAIAIENERDEDIEVDGEEGGLPQLPAGSLDIVSLSGMPVAWTVSNVTFSATGMEAAGCYGPTDPEPEFVDINDENIAVVSFQENNCLAIIDIESQSVKRIFDAGVVSLEGIDTQEEDVITLNGSLEDLPREPDAIAWIKMPYGEDKIATANEGDLFGGSRGFSIFEQDGDVAYDSDTSFEYLAVQHGHYPEGRSENKGSEPEAIAFGRYGSSNYLFVGSERGSFVAVYKLGWDGTPKFEQLLPAPLGPEGLLPVPSRNLLIVSGEEDDPEFGVRSTMMIYKLGRGGADYPHILSDTDTSGKPIPWSAMSGMTSAGRNLLAVQDSFYAEPNIYTIDPKKSPARIIKATPISGSLGGNLDPEGITVAPDGTYWIASEGNASGARPNRLLQTDAWGTVLQEVGLPAEIEACRAASDSDGSLGAGFEGVASIGTRRNYVLLVAQQRGWNYTTDGCQELDDDPSDTGSEEPGYTRIWIYTPKTGEWSAISYELAPVPENAAWMGLSEISIAGFSVIVIERDNRTGDFAEYKTLARISLFDLLDGEITADEKDVFDLLPAMRATNGWISDKPEGVAIGRGGEVYLITDNDGVDDWSGETQFLELGRYWKLF